MHRYLCCLHKRSVMAVLLHERDGRGSVWCCEGVCQRAQRGGMGAAVLQQRDASVAVWDAGLAGKDSFTGSVGPRGDSLLTALHDLFVRRRVQGQGAWVGVDDHRRSTGFELHGFEQYAYAAVVLRIAVCQGLQHRGRKLWGLG